MAAKVRRRPSMLALALEYAGYGWHVFPLITKEPDGRLAPHGFKDATTDEATIRKWWSKQQRANIGVATGHVSGILVVDVDPRHGGDEGLAQIEKEFGSFDDVPCVLTGGGGKHFYFRMPDKKIRCSAGMVAPGVDIKGDGGYVVAAGSLHESGTRYHWREA